MLDQIRGLICPMVTPFDDAGGVDYVATRTLVDFLIDNGVQVLFPCGSTGEGPLLTLEERMRLAEVVIDQTAARVPVVIHTGAQSTDDSITLTRHAHDIGADAASLITPYFYTYTDEEIFQHYCAVARSVDDFPLFVYVYPGNAKNDVSPQLLQRLRATVNIVGIKSSNPDLKRLREYIEVGNHGFIPLCGVDELMLAGLSIGSQGQVSGNANVCPELFRQLYDAYLAGDLATATACQLRIDRVRQILHDGAHLAAFKAGLAMRGVPVGRVRAPMRELSCNERNTLARELSEFGVPMADAK